MLASGPVAMSSGDIIFLKGSGKDETGFQSRWRMGQPLFAAVIGAHTADCKQPKTGVAGLANKLRAKQNERPAIPVPD